jgi:hypothetical protein
MEYKLDHIWPADRGPDSEVEELTAADVRRYETIDTERGRI